MIQTEAMNSAIDEASRQGTSSSRFLESLGAMATPDPQQLVYRASLARTRTNIASFAKKSRRRDSKGAAELERLSATQDIMGVVEHQMQTVGLTKNNLADAYTVWWTNAWLATQGRDDTLPRHQMQAVKRQAEATLLSTPEVMRLNDVQKQEFAEGLLVQAMLISASVERFKEQGRDLRPLKDAVTTGAWATGVDLATMTLTDKGFGPIRGPNTSGDD